MYICYLDEVNDFFGFFKVHRRTFEIELHRSFWKKERHVTSHSNYFGLCLRSTPILGQLEDASKALQYGNLNSLGTWSPRVDPNFIFGSPGSDPNFIFGPADEDCSVWHYLASVPISTTSD